MEKKPFALRGWERRKLKAPEDVRNYVQNLRLISSGRSFFRFKAFGKDHLPKDAADSGTVACACRFDRPLILSATNKTIELFPEINGAFSFSDGSLERSFRPDESVNTDLNYLFGDCLNQTIKDIEYETFNVRKWLVGEVRLKSLSFVLENGLCLRISHNEKGFYDAECLNPDGSLHTVSSEKCGQGLLSWRNAHAKPFADSCKTELENYLRNNLQEEVVFYQCVFTDDDEDEDFDDEDVELCSVPPAHPEENKAVDTLLRKRLEKTDKTFSEKLMEWISVKNISEVECYKKAGIDRRLFSKIRSDKNYRPSLNTAIAFALALELTIEETNDLLKRAGHYLSTSSRGDMIVRFFIEKGVWDLMIINEALYQFGEPLIGRF